MLFTEFFDESILAKANRFEDDTLLIELYGAIQKKMESRPIFPITRDRNNLVLSNSHQTEIQTAKYDFLKRLAFLEDRERSEQLELKNQELDQRLLELQSEVADLAKRGHSLTQRATLFAGLAGVLSLFGVCFTGLQFFESQKANQLIEVQNSYLQQQNQIAADALEFSKSKPPPPAKKAGK